MKSIKTLFIILILSFLNLSAHTELNKLFTKKQINYLNSKKELALCIDPTWMPFEKLDENTNHTGISKEYFDIFRRNLPIPIRLIKTSNWTETLEYMKDKKCDILSLAMVSEERKEYMNFSSSYINTPLVLTTKIDVSFIDDIKSLSNKKLGIVKGYIYEKLLKQRYPYLDFVSVKNTDDGFEKVIKGELFGFISSLSTAAYKFEERYVGQLKIAAKFHEKLNLSMAFRKDEPILVEIFETLLSHIPESKRQDIYNKYVAISYENRVDYTLVVYSVIFFILIIVFFIYWNRKLKMQKEETEKVLTELKATKKLLEEKNEKLEKLYITDELTKIYNRRKLDVELEKETLRSDRTGFKFSLIMLDIDFFKEVNDNYGHQVGDLVLIEFSKILKNDVRKIDILGRWGGEEFLIICPHTDETGIKVKAEHLRELIENHKFPEVNKKTASIGAATYKDGDDTESLLYRVDMAMYEAKNSGRNKIVFFE